MWIIFVSLRRLAVA